MKRIIAVLCAAVLMVSLSAVAFAADDDQGSGWDATVNERQLSKGEKPSGPQDMFDFDELVAEGIISQETCDMIKAYMEEHRPSDLPEMSGQRPEKNAEASNGEVPSDLPEMPSMDGKGPEMNGQAHEGEAPADLPEHPGMGMFSEMVNEGLISQEICDIIEAYMEEHRPEGFPEMGGQFPQMNGQAPEMGGQPPQMNGQLPKMGGQPPQMNGQLPEMGGQPPQMNGQLPEMDAQPPQMNGQLPEMDAQPPQMNGQLPEMGSQPPQMSGQTFA